MLKIKQINWIGNDGVIEGYIDVRVVFLIKRDDKTGFSLTGIGVAPALSRNYNTEDEAKDNAQQLLSHLIKSFIE